MNQIPIRYLANFKVKTVDPQLRACHLEITDHAPLNLAVRNTKNSRQLTRLISKRSAIWDDASCGNRAHPTLVCCPIKIIRSSDHQRVSVYQIFQTIVTTSHWTTQFTMFCDDLEHKSFNAMLCECEFLYVQYKMQKIAESWLVNPESVMFKSKHEQLKTVCSTDTHHTHTREKCSFAKWSNDEWLILLEMIICNYSLILCLPFHYNDKWSVSWFDDCEKLRRFTIH